MTTISWENPVSGDWTDAADWSSGTVPTSTDDVTIQDNFANGYIIRITSADVAKTLTFDASGTYFGGAELLENAGSLTLSGALTVEGGLVALNRANSIGGVSLTGGVLSVGDAGALGTGSLTVDGNGELLGTANETLANSIDIVSSPLTIAAAHGTTLDVGSGGWGFISALPSFGDPGRDGTVVAHATASDFEGLLPPANEVRGGTLKAGDAHLGDLLFKPIVDAGATLDIAGFNVSLNALQGFGTVTDSGGSATLTVGGGSFGGSITGPISLHVDGFATLTGTNTYTGTTTINGGAGLTLGNGGTTGSIGGGAIDDEGTLTIDRSDAFTLTNAISGVGLLTQAGPGTTSINTANTYTGQTTISAGTLAVGNGGAVGTGTLTMTGGELLGTANETLTNDLVMQGSVTIAAAHGTTLDIEADNLQLTQNFGDALVFGAPGRDGTVVFNTGSTNGFGTGGGVTEVRGGTLEGGDTQGDRPFFGSQVIIDAGATFDLAGISQSGHSPVQNLIGAGTVTNSGAIAELDLQDANFAGTFSGAMSLDVQTTSLFSGLSDYTGDTEIDDLATLTNTGVFDLVSNSGVTTVDSEPTATFVNDGLFEKTGGGGVSTVEASFTNNGTIAVTGGSISFTGGFTNHGNIQGVVSQSGGATTISAIPDRPPAQATHTVTAHEGASTGTLSAGDTDPDGDSIAVTALSGGTVGSPDAGAYGTLTLNTDDTFSYAAAIDAAPAGTSPTDTFTYTVSDGRGGSTTETLQFSISRPPQVANSNVDEWLLLNGHWAGSAEPGSIPSGYQVAGIGDFTGNGTSDILWQNPANGDTQEWLIDNGGWAGTVDLDAHPGNFQIAGVGDFNGDGVSDVLWTGASGGSVQTDIWELAASGKWMASVSPGAHPGGYAVAATGDWTGNGTAGILWYNASTGDTDEWQLNNGKWAASVDLGTHPGNFQISGVGDFFGDGRDDVLWTGDNADGTVATDIWELGSNGQWINSVSPGNHPAGSQVVGVGDFTGTGTSDILWYNGSNGDTDEWLIKNGQWAGSIDLGTHPGGFQIAGVGDFNGHGNADVLWHAPS